MWKSNLKLETKSLIYAVQEQALRTNYVEHKVDNSGAKNKNRLHVLKVEKFIVCHLSVYDADTKRIQATP